MGQFYAIFRNTFWEAVRQPVFGMMLIIVALLVMAAPLSGAHIYTLSVGTNMEHAAQRSVAEMGLSYILLSGLVLAVFVASGIVNREIEEKTALTVLTKNIRRVTFVCGKFAGVATAVAMAVASWAMLTMLTARFGSNTAAWQGFDFGAFGGTVLAALVAIAVATWKNYFHGKSWVGNFSLAFFLALTVVFTALACVTSDYKWAFADGMRGAHDWQIAIAAFLTLEAITILCALSVAFSTRFSTAVNFCLCLLLFAGGLTYDFVYANYHAACPWLLAAWRVAVPHLQAFWMCEALKYEVDIPWEYAAGCTVYAALYLVGALCLAAALFDRREIT